jgi:hypothetical protein
MSGNKHRPAIEGIVIGAAAALAHGAVKKALHNGGRKPQHYIAHKRMQQRKTSFIRRFVVACMIIGFGCWYLATNVYHVNTRASAEINCVGVLVFDPDTGMGEPSNVVCK